MVLRSLLETCAALPDVTGPLSALDEAWDLLSRAHLADPESCDDVLAQPAVGVWAAYTLRRVGRPAPVPQPPLWADVGYLHGLAVACGVRAGLAFELDVPIRDSTAVLPTVGAATFPVGLGSARAVNDGKLLVLMAGAVTVRAAADDPRWHEPIRIDAGAGGRNLRVDLLDRDVYRDLRRPMAPRPLSGAEIDRWRSLVGDAWRLLVDEQPERATAIAASLRTLTPVPRAAPYRQLSASSVEAFGGILLSEPDDATQLAMTLVHESQHHKLGALLHMLTLVEGGAEIRYYAPWRDDPRPLSGLLQGVYAFTGVTDFWRVHRHRAGPVEAPLAGFEFALWRRQALNAARVLAGSGKLTDHGRCFVGTLTAQLSAWQDEPVPADISVLAEDAALDHHALWRAYCIPVAPAASAVLTAAFRAGDPVPSAVLSETDVAVVATPAVGWLDGRAVLVRHRLAGTGESARPPVDGTTARDVDLVYGRVADARAGYLGDLERDPGDAHAWCGLGLTLDRAADPAARALLGRPELLAAMARSGRLEPLEAARWLGRALPVETLGAPRPAGWRVA